MTDPLAALAAESRARTRRVRDMLLEAGRPDLVAELDRNLWDVANGTSNARGTWHALSPAQRRVMVALAAGHSIARSKTTPGAFDVLGGPDGPRRNICRAATLRPMEARKLIAFDGGLDDPLRRGCATEHGRFVVKHGRPKNDKPRPVRARGSE